MTHLTELNCYTWYAITCSLLIVVSKERLYRKLPVKVELFHIQKFYKWSLYATSDNLISYCVIPNSLERCY